MPAAYDQFVDTAELIRHGWFASEDAVSADVSAASGLLADINPDVALGMMHYSSALVVLGATQARLPLRTIASFRGPLSEHITRYETGRDRIKFLTEIVSETSTLAHRLVVPSKGTADDACMHFGADPDRTLVIPNGIDLHAAQAAAADNDPDLAKVPCNVPVLCVAARLSAEKEIGLLIDAVAAARRSVDCALLIVGDGPDRTKLEQQVSSLGISAQVTFVGHRANVFPFIRRADLYVHTCQFEGFGYAMLEAMACGTPVLATDCPHGPREVLQDGRWGRLVAPADAGALADGIIDLLSHRAELERLAEAALIRARELSVERMVSRYQQVMTELTTNA
jgi:glycosyltransferase involved in cell wall biosynthesis